MYAKGLGLHDCAGGGEGDLALFLSGLASQALISALPAENGDGCMHGFLGCIAYLVTGLSRSCDDTHEC